MQNIVLTGFMGTGKTSVGRLIAQQLDMEFVDTDELVVAHDGRTIPDIFAQSGEAYFRSCEAAVVRTLAGRSNLVIATGGGLLLDPENAAALAATGHIFCLTASLPEIRRRLKGDSGRPLLAGEDAAMRLTTLLQERAAGYARFPQIDTDGKNVNKVAREIIVCMQMN